MKRGFFKVGGGRTKLLMPSDRASEAILDGCKQGDVVRVQISKPRHPGHHRKYWAMLKIVHEGTAVQDLYPTIRTVSLPPPEDWESAINLNRPVT